MAHGPNRHGNRFRVLDEDPGPETQPNKKQKTTLTPLYNYPDLPTKCNAKNPRFILISPKIVEKPISSLSPFLLKKAIDNISKEYDQISQLRDGNLLILVKSQKIANIFLKVNNLASVCPVVVKLHDRLNASKGVVYAPCLINVSETEIVTEMKPQGVTEVYKFTKNDNGKQRATGLMLFTFDLFQIPNSVEIGFYNTKVTEYIPNPMRCRNCQLLGHTIKRCNGDPKCESCNLPPHAPDSCARIMCANCSLPHPSSSKACPSYKQAKEIITIKTKQKCTMAEAKRIYKLQTPSQTLSASETFAEKVKHSTQIQQNLSIPQPGPTHIPPPPLRNTTTTNTTSSAILKASNPTKSHNFLNEHNNNTTLEKPPTDFTAQPSKSFISPRTTSSNPNLSFTSSTSTNSNMSPTLSNSTAHTDFTSTPTTNTVNCTQILTHSPISTVTQALLKNNDYYVNTSEQGDDHV